MNVGLKSQAVEGFLQPCLDLTCSMTQSLQDIGKITFLLLSDKFEDTKDNCHENHIAIIFQTC